MVPSASVRSVAGTDAPRVPCQHAGACEAMRFRRVWIAASCPALVFGFPALVTQGAGGYQVRAAGGGAYLVHQIPHRRPGMSGVHLPRRSPSWPPPIHGPPTQRVSPPWSTSFGATAPRVASGSTPNSNDYKHLKEKHRPFGHGASSLTDYADSPSCASRVSTSSA